MPVWKYQVGDDLYYSATYLTPDDASNERDCGDDDGEPLSFVSPPMSRYCFNLLFFDLPRYCCIGMSTETQDFTDALPACEPWYAPRNFFDCYRASPARLCHALAAASDLGNEQWPLEIMCQEWPRLQPMRAELKARVAALLESICAGAPDEHSLLGRAFLHFGRSGLVGRLALAKPSVVLKAFLLNENKK